MAVAITEKGAEVIEDQESLDAWRASAASADAHRIGFVWMRDDSGKGATVGYPSEVEWHDGPTLVDGFWLRAPDVGAVPAEEMEGEG